MNIYFVYSDINNTQPNGYQVGLGYVAAMVKVRGHQIRYFSPQNKLDIKLLLREVKIHQPDIIAFSAVSTQFRYVKIIAYEIKKMYNPKIVCGGIHTTILPECLEESEHIDAIIRGEGEFPFIEYVDSLQKKDGKTCIDNVWLRENNKIIQNNMRGPIQDLDILPFPERESMDFQATVDKVGFCNFIFSRGCFFNCSYCCNSVLNQLYGSNNVRFRSASKAIEEIDTVLAKHRIPYLNFDDDNFTFNKEWFFEFIEKYRKAIKRKFFCNLRVGACTFEMLQVLKDADCVGVLMGVESGDEEFRQKYLNRQMTNKQIIETFEMAHRVGLKTYSFNIIGFPYETPELFERTIELNARIYPNTPYLAIFYPYPKTYLRELCERKNLLIDNKLEDRAIKERDEPVLNSPDFTKKQIAYFYKNFYYLVLKKAFILNTNFIFLLKIVKEVFSNEIRKIIFFFKLSASRNINKNI